MKTYLFKGTYFERQGENRFLKDCLQVGRWVHPGTGKLVEFDSTRLHRLVEDTNKWVALGNKVRLTWGHPGPDGKHKKENILGDWPDGFIVVGERLWGVASPKDEETVAKMKNGSLDSVSIGTRTDVLSQKGGETFDEIIDHVAITPYPVVTEQSDFIGLSKDMDVGERQGYVPQSLSSFGGSPDPIHLGALADFLNSEMEKKDITTAQMASAAGISEGTVSRILRSEIDRPPDRRLSGFARVLGTSLSRLKGLLPADKREEMAMDMKAFAKLLSVKENASDSDIEAAIEGLKVSKEGADKVTAALGAKLGEHGLVLSIDGDKITVSKKTTDGPPKTAKEKELADRLDQYDEKFQRQTLDAVTVKVEELIKGGQVPPAQEENLRKLLGITGSAKTVMMSGDPQKMQDTMVEVSGLAYDVLKSLPSVHDDKLRQLESFKPTDGEQTEKDKLTKLAQESASRVGETHSAEAAKK